MRRKQFIKSQGATCSNWSWSWSFVNHKRKFVIFGVWSDHVKGDIQTILGESWRISGKDRIQAGYTQAIEHIRLVEGKGYRLKTFVMEYSDDYDANGPARIGSFEQKLYSKKLMKDGEDWLAIDTDVANDEKIARICWNSEGWQRPSGSDGKSSNPDAYESQNGYGHEEWLLDTSKLIDGYHYAYVQAIGSHRDTYLGDPYDISFYSIDGDTKQRWWLGTIRNVQIVGEHEAKRVYEIYKKNGWYDEMSDQLKRVGASVEAFKKFTTPETFAVIKFKIDDLELLDEPLEFSQTDPAVTSDYYNLKNKEREPELGKLGDFTFVPGHNAKKGKGQGRSTYKKPIEDLDLLHNRIQTALFEHLKSVHGEDNVGTENPTGRRTLIDAVVQHSKQYTFYEIKTSQSVRQCIRDALGQLLEYAHFGSPIFIRELIVVSPYKTTSDVSKYLETLREKYGLPIAYRQFDMDSSTLKV